MKTTTNKEAWNNATPEYRRFVKSMMCVIAVLLFGCMIVCIVQDNSIGNPCHGLSDTSCYEISHQQYLDSKKELNDAIYGTPEMRREDVARKIADDAASDAK
jgi:hypothetical protein